MALPIIPAVLMAAGAGLVAYEAAFKKKSGASPSPSTPGTPAAPGAPSAPGGVMPQPSGPAAPSQMPPELRAAYSALLAQADAADPDQLDLVAGQLAQYGFVTEANQLRAKAAEIRARRAAPQPSLPVIPSTVPQMPAIPAVVVPTNAGSQARVTAPNGVRIRSAPNSSAAEVSSPVPQGTRLGVVDWNGGGPTADAPKGWAKVLAPTGAVGFATKEWLVLESGGSVAPAPASPPPPPAPGGATAMVARVTAPNGVRIRSAPNAGAAEVASPVPQGTMLPVVNWEGGPPTSGAPQGWAQVRAPNGATGYSTKEYLSAQQVATSGVAKASDGNGRPVTCLAPQGCRIRQSPSPNGKALAVFPNGETAQLVRHVSGAKGSPASPGPGGWCLIRWANFQGWVPSEWMRLS